ncbi:MAG: hypothetical protein ACRCSO_02925 [Sphingomonas sp.]
MKATTLRRVRQLHFYLGLFFAPMLLLFAVSGALQVYRLNDAKGGNVPPTWLAWIASIHKNQAPPRERPANPADKSDAKQDHAGSTTSKAGEAPGKALEKAGTPSIGVAALKIFAVLLAVALAISTLLGIIIAVQTRSMRRTGIILLVAGTILPIVLLKL